MSARRVALVGYGLAGRVFHGPLVDAEPALELALVVTSDPERAEEVRRRHPGARVVASVDEVVAETPDLVVVAAPTPTHALLAEQVLEAGLPVVVDKPLAVRAADAERLVALAEQRGVPLTVFQNRRLDGDLLTIAALLERGELGDVWRFESRFEWISSRPRPAWKSGTAGRDGGGVAYDLGAHLVDQAIRLFGPVAEVYGELDTRRGGGVNDDDAFIALTHRSGVRSHLGMASIVAQRGFRFRVLGSEGAYAKWGLDPQEAQLASGMSPLDDAFGRTPEAEDGLVGRDGDARRLPTERGRYRDFYRQVAAALAGEGAMPVDPRDAIEPIRIVERLQAER